MSWFTDFNWLHVEYSFDVIQYQVKRLCNKPEINTDLLPLFWTRDFNFGQVASQVELVCGQVRKIHISTPLPSLKKFNYW